MLSESIRYDEKKSASLSSEMARRESKVDARDCSSLWSCSSFWREGNTVGAGQILCSERLIFGKWMLLDVLFDADVSGMGF